LAFAAKPVLSIAPRRGAAHLNALAQAVYDVQPRLEEPDYETTFADLRQRYTKRSLIVFFTDMFDPVTSAAVLSGLAVLVRRHLVICVLMNDQAIAKALDSTPATPREAYRTSVAMSLADERARAIAVLRSRGIIVVDVPAPKLTVAVLDAYLDVKASRQTEIRDQQHGGNRADAEAKGDARAQRRDEAFDRARDDEHARDADHQDAGAPALLLQRVDAPQAAGRDDRLRQQ
jgi:hypothetical protein